MSERSIAEMLQESQNNQLDKFDRSRAVTVGQFAVDPESHVVATGTQLVSLTPAESRTLLTIHTGSWMSYHDIARLIDESRAHDRKPHGSVSPNHVGKWITGLEDKLGATFERDGRKIRLVNPHALDQDQ